MHLVRRNCLNVLWVDNFAYIPIHHGFFWNLKNFDYINKNNDIGIATSELSKRKLVYSEHHRVSISRKLSKHPIVAVLPRVRNVSENLVNSFGGEISMTFAGCCYCCCWLEQIKRVVQRQSGKFLEENWKNESVDAFYDVINIQSSFGNWYCWLVAPLTVSSLVNKLIKLIN